MPALLAQAKWRACGIMEWLAFGVRPVFRVLDKTMFDRGLGRL